MSWLFHGIVLALGVGAGVVAFFFASTLVASLVGSNVSVGLYALLYKYKADYEQHLLRQTLEVLDVDEDQISACGL